MHTSSLTTGARLRAAARSAALGVALALTSGLASAQASDVPPNYKIDENGVKHLLGRPKGFRLFAGEDEAYGAPKMTGRYGFGVTNVAFLCPFEPNSTGHPMRCGATNGTTVYFDIVPVYGVPISDFRKIRTVWPGVANMAGVFGYSTPHMSTAAPPFVSRMGAADGSFGHLFSGVTSEAGTGSCRDINGTINGRVNAGSTLLAMSDCPETWPSSGYDGKRPVLDDGWLAAFRSDPQAFHWNDWQVPKSAIDTLQFLGSGSTYGKSTDYTREIIQLYGGVTKLGSGKPTERGFPLGLEMRLDSWQFGRPSVRDVAFYQMTVVNKSADVYGAGIDYDSLYMGFGPEMAGSGGQNGAAYDDFSRGAFIITGGGTSGAGKCTVSFPKRLPGTSGCPGGNGFSKPATFIMWLKSPLGDLRNKLFSDPTSLYYNPTSPFADDTITYNHRKRNSFGATYNNVYARSDRSIFGYLSGTEENFLDGRTFADFSVSQIFEHFQYEGFDGTVSANNAKFNRFVPSTTDQPGQPGVKYGKWDYNEDGVPDTIYTPSCGTTGCVRVFGDSMMGGFVTQIGNAGSPAAAGPFKLKAGDTTQFLWALGGGPTDSTQFEQLLNNVVTSYLGNYAGANPIKAPELTASDVEITPAAINDSVDGTQTATVRIRLVEPKPYRDVFVQTEFARLGGTNNVWLNRRYKLLDSLNPGLRAAVGARITSNFSQLQIFKSCDAGANWTTSTGATADCAPAIARDVNNANIGFGWRPITTRTVDSTTGKFFSGTTQNNNYTDNVMPGRTYLYSLVSRSRGLVGIPIVDSIGCNGSLVTVGVAPNAHTECTFGQIRTGPSDLKKALAIDADTISSPLFRSGPSTVTVYAPITLPAGTVLSKLDTVTVGGVSTQTITPTARASIKPGKYRVVFGNRFIVKIVRDTVAGTSTDTVTVQRILFGANTPGNLRQAEFVQSSTVYASAGEPIVANNATVQTPTRVPGSVGSKVTFLNTYTAVNAATGGLGYMIAQDGGGKVFFIGTTTYATVPSAANPTVPANPPIEYENSGDYPGFLFTLETLQGNNLPRRISTPGGTGVQGILFRALGDTLFPSVHEGTGVSYQAAPSSRTLVGPTFGGKYTVAWAGDAFGPDGPFKWGTIDSMTPIVTQSLARRVVTSTASVDTATHVIISKALAATTAITCTNTSTDVRCRKLVPAKMPFTVTTPNGVCAGPGTACTIAMWQRNLPAAVDSGVKNSRVFGTQVDTTRVSVAVDMWMPGDTLIVLEKVTVDSTVGTGVTLSKVIDPGTGLPYRVQHDTVTFARFVLGCNSNSTPSRLTCNPISLGTRAATTYLPYESRWVSEVDFVKPFDLFSELVLTATARVADAQTAKNVNRQVTVVPNPYVVQSDYDQINSSRIGTPTIMFTNVPSEGILRVYSISGQFLQQITWTEAELINRGIQFSGPGATTNGDLSYNLRTREGLELGSGLYLWVLNGTGTHKGFQQRGKFVIIR